MNFDRPNEAQELILDFYTKEFQPLDDAQSKEQNESRKYTGNRKVS